VGAVYFGELRVARTRQQVAVGTSGSTRGPASQRTFVAQRMWVGRNWHRSGDLMETSKYTPVDEHRMQDKDRAKGRATAHIVIRKCAGTRSADHR
jgi:hypothetical protein